MKQSRNQYRVCTASHGPIGRFARVARIEKITLKIQFFSSLLDEFNR